MTNRAWPTPYKVFPDPKTPFCFFVFDNENNLFEDISLETADETAKFIEDACNKIERYEKALKFYADMKHVSFNKDIYGDVINVCSEFGETARKALEGTK